jgi:short-subunit dehydrogenase
MGGQLPVALVTGASSGIGEAYAGRLAARGYHVLLVARRRDRLDRLASKLGNAETVQADLAVEADVERLAARIAAEPRFEFLVNNAGFGTMGMFHEADAGGQEAMHRVHVMATMRLTRAALPGMVSRRTGAVVNVSSVAAFFHNPLNVSYCATKAWMNTFTEGVYVELKAIGSPVRAQCLCPGFTYSEFHDVLNVDRQAIPRSLWASPEEVVDTSLRALESNKLIVIPGWRYRLAAQVQQLLPQGVRHAIALRYGKRSRTPR